MAVDAVSILGNISSSFELLCLRETFIDVHLVSYLNKASYMNK